MGKNITLLILLCFACMNSALSQVVWVQGSVKDLNGDPVIGASVMIKGTSKGVVVGLDGGFKIEVEKGKILVAHALGYGKKEVAVSDVKIAIILSEDVTKLDELVVIGYGAVKKSDLTGSVASVKVDAIQNIPANSVTSLLQGRSAGLQIVNSSQDPGAAPVIRIRGGSSLHGSNSPLIVVDGFPLGDGSDLKQFNPADIQSIEVLKDASASAIYGSRGANGVIMVTTRKSKEGVTRVHLTQQTTVSQFTSKLDIWRNSALMAQLNNEGRVNASLAPMYVGAINPGSGIYYPSVNEILDGRWAHNTNWDEIVFRDAPVSNNTSITVNSTNAKTAYSLSANFFDDNGIYINDDYTKGTVRLGIDHKLFENFSIRTNNILAKDTRNSNGGLAFWRNPIWPVYNEDGSYFLAGENDFSHPLALTNHRTSKYNGIDLLSSLVLDWNITKGLNLRSQVNYKYGSSVSDVYNRKKYTEEGFYNNGAAHLSNWMGQNVVSETYMTYNRPLGTEDSGHLLSTMLGHSYEYTMSRSSKLSSYDFVNEAMGNENMGAGDPERNVLGNGYGESALVSYWGRVNLTLKDRYLFTATMRADGSSKFGANNKWAYFPSGAVSWKLHNEEFMKQLEAVNEFKLRASYGISGNQGISAYQTLSRYGVEKYFDNGKWNTAIGPGYPNGFYGPDGRFIEWAGVPNRNLKWETTAQWNIGADIAFLDSRIRLTADYYVKNTYDLLRQRYLPLSSGYDKMWVNDGEVNNRGFELTIEGDIIDREGLKFSANAMLSKNKNKVVSLGDTKSSGLSIDPNTGMKYEFWGASLGQFLARPNILAVGRPINVFYGHKVDGIVQTREEGLAAGLTGDFANPGEFKYVDINGDGVVNDADRTVIGDPNPDFMASIALNFTYKRFDMEIFLNGVVGGDVINTTKWNGGASNAPLRWTPDNQTNGYPSLRENRSYKFSEWFIEDGSYLRIQNVNLGYNVPLPKTSRLSSLRFYMNASNLFTFSKFEGYDPEVGLDGVYWGGYPRLRKWTFGVDITL